MVLIRSKHPFCSALNIFSDEILFNTLFDFFTPNAIEKIRAQEKKGAPVRWRGVII